MPRGVIFGLDDVLVRTDEARFLACSEIAGRLGASFTPQVNEGLRGMSTAESLDVIIALGSTDISETEKTVLAEEMDAVYREILRGLSPASIDPGAHDTLAALRERGLRLAVASSSRNTRMVLERTGLRDRFDAVSDGENIRRAEPDPEVYVRAADFLALDPSECVAVAGTAAGIEAASSAGFTTYGIGSASSHPHARISIGGLSELLQYFVV